MRDEKRARPVQIKFRVTAQEQKMIEEKMRQLGTQNMGAYLRKMAIDGYVLRLDLPELKEMISLLRRTSNNVNQIARRLNETGRIYEVDVGEVQAQQERLWEGMRSLLSRFSELQ